MKKIYNPFILVQLLLILIFSVNCKKPSNSEIEYIEQPITFTGSVHRKCNSNPSKGITVTLRHSFGGNSFNTTTDSLGNFYFDFIHNIDPRFSSSQNITPEDYHYSISTLVNGRHHWVMIDSSSSTTNKLKTFKNDTVNFITRESDEAIIKVNILSPSADGPNYVEFEKCKKTQPGNPLNCIEYYIDEVSYHLDGKGWFSFNYKIVRDTVITFHTDSIYLSCNDSTYYFSR